MVKRLSVYLLVFSLTFSLSLFLNACSKKVIRDREGIEKKEEAAKAEEKVLPKEEAKEEAKGEPKVSQPLKSEEDDNAAREAQLREEELKKQREKEEEAASREEATKREEAAKIEEAAKREEAAKIEEATKREEAAKIEAKSKEEFENTDINFGFDKFSLTNEAREILAKKSSWLQNHTDMKIKIEGHCDERGSNEYNMALGERRANSAMQYLVTAGVEASRISTISYGEEKPLDPGHNEKAWAKIEGRTLK